jgi:hypothetical protein
VRIVRDSGYSFVFANNQGFFRFPDIPLDNYLLQAPGPSQESLIEWMRKQGIDPRSAFTAIPPDLPPELASTQVIDFSDENEALASISTVRSSPNTPTNRLTNQ